MSRSYKQNYLKDSSKGMKAIHARRRRRHVKQTINAVTKLNPPLWHVREEDEMFIWEPNEEWFLEFKHDFALTSPYDICDWWWGPWINGEYLEDKPYGTYWIWKNGYRLVRK